MEVKSVYMDLQEGKKKGNVWKLESEAFKKPIELKIWFESAELAEFNRRCDNLEWVLATHRGIMNLHADSIRWLEEWLKHSWELHQAFNWNIDKVREKLDEEWKERKELLKEVATLKSIVELQNWTILHLQEQVKLLEKKTTKQPSVFHEKCFISWRESAGLWMFNLNDWDYLMVAKYVVWEHNEYVDNKDDIVIEKIHVEGQHYVPFYKLEWGTELDTPTATIYYDLVFIPI